VSARPAAGAAPSADWLRARLAPQVAAQGCELAPSAPDQLARYLGLLLPWTARVNLTAARDAETIVAAHLADGVALLRQLPPAAHRLVDVGAGAGFVGVTLAVLRPDARCVLLEPAMKRYAFLRAVARELLLPNLEPRAERLEDHLARPDLVPYDVAVSRATWPPLEWLAHAPALLRPGGLAVAFEGGRRLALPPGVARVERPDGRGSLLLQRLPG
jgi:16S rRNA (guanine527-N7)-methyltransferase